VKALVVEHVSVPVILPLFTLFVCLPLFLSFCLRSTLVSTIFAIANAA